VVRAGLESCGVLGKTMPPVVGSLHFMSPPGLRIDGGGGDPRFSPLGGTVGPPPFDNTINITF